MKKQREGTVNQVAQDDTTTTDRIEDKNGDSNTRIIEHVMQNKLCCRFLQGNFGKKTEVFNFDSADGAIVSLKRVKDFSCAICVLWDNGSAVPVNGRWVIGSEAA